MVRHVLRYWQPLLLMDFASGAKSKQLDTLESNVRSRVNKSQEIFII